MRRTVGKTNRRRWNFFRIYITKSTVMPFDMHTSATHMLSRNQSFVGVTCIGTHYKYICLAKVAITASRICYISVKSLSLFRLDWIGLD